MNASETIQSIERERRQREKELALMFAMFMARTRRYAVHAVRLGLDPLSAMRLVWLGSDHFSGIVTPLSRAMASAHNGGAEVAAKLIGAEPPVVMTAAVYRDDANVAAEQMLSTLQMRVMESLDGVFDAKQKIAAIRSAFANGYTQDNPWALQRAAGQLTVPFAAGMAEGYELYKSGPGSVHGGQGVKQAGGYRAHTGFRHHTVHDDGTTDICEDRSELTLPKDDPYWLTNWPPLHFSCRSIVLPVTGAQHWSQSYPTIPPAPGFGRLPAFMGAVEPWRTGQAA